MSEHIVYMARAITLAKQGLYSTDPNPRVGCVLVKDGQIVGEGFHVRAGEGHAEVNALRAAGENARGATAYVTLEPCSHFGRTPPCADGLMGAGVTKVVCAMQDPNPLVAGNGFAKLRAAGIDVLSGVLESQARALNPGFIKRMQTGLPFVRIKMASSLDGRTAMHSGESQWITGPAARADVQKFRARSSAIICGVDSVLLDDPALTVRASELILDAGTAAPQQQPLRVVLDSQGRMPVSAKLLNQLGKTLLVGITGQQYAPVANAERICLPADANGRVALNTLLLELGKRQCNEVLVETGATLAGAFIQAGLCDEIVHYLAPCLMGSEARPVFALPFTQMAERLFVQIQDVRQLGEDMRLTYGLKSVN
jgi:diaminohydroxyphosphoribosylaminopyrimidine deaminase / 5-amino-6-(5-phosphoribosylamino)uracil reductase